MGRGVIDLPMDVIIRYLESHEYRKDWDRFLVVSVPDYCTAHHCISDGVVLWNIPEIPYQCLVVYSK